MQLHAARYFPNAMPSTSPHMHINVRLNKLLYIEALVNTYFVDYLPSFVNLKANTTLKKYTILKNKLDTCIFFAIHHK